MAGVNDEFGLSCTQSIEQPISEKLLSGRDCSEGSGCRPPLSEVQKLVILGAGPAGLSAAIYAARANLDPVVVSVDGGQLEGTAEVENYPGAQPPSDCDDDDEEGGEGGGPAGGAAAAAAAAAPKAPKTPRTAKKAKKRLHGVSGSAIVQTFNEQAKAFGTRFIEGWVEAISYPTPPFVLRLVGGRVIRANALIIASGASTRWLGLPSETKYRGSGVSSCATCDGFFFKGQRVAVIGGGDAAVEEALFLSRICASVVMIHRRDRFSRATPLLVDQVRANPKIRTVFNATVDEFYSADGSLLTHVIVKDVHSGELTDLEVEGAFVKIGLTPNTQLLEVRRPTWAKLSREQLAAAALLNISSENWPPQPRPGTTVQLDGDGFIVTERASTATTVSGIFAAGDVSDNIYRQAITSAGSGAMAALDAERWLCRLGC